MWYLTTRSPPLESRAMPSIVPRAISVTCKPAGKYAFDRCQNRRNTASLDAALQGAAFDAAAAAPPRGELNESVRNLSIMGASSGAVKKL